MAVVVLVVAAPCTSGPPLPSSWGGGSWDQEGMTTGAGAAVALSGGTPRITSELRLAARRRSCRRSGLVRRRGRLSPRTLPHRRLRRLCFRPALTLPRPLEHGQD